MSNYPDVESDLGNCELFLQNFVTKGDNAVPKYMDMLQEIANRKRKRLDIHLDDVNRYYAGQSKDKFLLAIESNTKRYIKLFASAADRLLPEPTNPDIEQDAFDYMVTQRTKFEDRNNDPIFRANPEAPIEDLGAVPPAMKRRYRVYILPRTRHPMKKLRDVSSEDVGHLVKLRGVITHVTDVKPVAEVVTYLDSETGYEMYQEVLGKTFKPLEGTEVDGPGGQKRKIYPWLNIHGCKFVKYQEARIQEMSDEIPEGATPRTMSIRLVGEVARSVKAGDEVLVAGVFVPEPFTGFRAMRAGLLASTFLEVMSVHHVKTSYAKESLTEEDMAAIQDVTEEGDVYNRLAGSIAPEIFGHEDVKKALLLLMVGGKHRSLSDGMKLRGDVHMCLMGDPGVAKSQLLKYVARVSPRAVYTTGRGSSGVGLTAAVLRDQVTKELVLEGGALVLADKGICCIDEFDKMDDTDRTAIHEVMEQQTVSIAKAGITTTLNTRTSVLAAANPTWSRYDKRHTAAENINMPAALLSRFDLLWLILDKVDEANDQKLALHIVNVHKIAGRSKEAPAAGEEVDPQAAAKEQLDQLGGWVDPKVLRAYIAHAKTFEDEVVVPEDLTDYIAEVYSDMRQLESEELGAKGTYTTARTLLSILRLAQALASLRFDRSVARTDIDEALRLMDQSKASLQDDDEGGAQEVDTVTACYHRILNYHESRHQNIIPFAKIKELCADVPSITSEVILTTIEQYRQIAVWEVQAGEDGNPMVFMMGDAE